MPNGWGAQGGPQLEGNALVTVFLFICLLLLAYWLTNIGRE